MGFTAKMESLLRLNRPDTQNFIMGWVLFCAPGIYVAVIGLGAGGGKPSSAQVASLTNVILYGLFALCGWFGGSLLNILKPKKSVMLGSIGYPLYVAGLWYYDRTGHSWFPLLAGALLGSLCGPLWTAAAFIQFAYPQEKDKAKFISIQWMLRSTGATVGAIIAFAANFHQQKAVGVSSAVYGTFTAIHCLPFFLALFFLVDPQKVVRKDGTHIAIFKPTKLSTELKSMAKAFFDPRMFILFPAILGCEMGLALVSSINAFYFNLRTRSLNNLAFHSIQVFMPWVMVFILDNRQVKSRKTRGFVGVACIAAISLGASAGLYAWLDINRIGSLKKPQAKDWTDPEFGGMFALFLLFGAIYAAYQMTIEWVVSALTNDPSKLAQFGGVFKGTLSLGICLSFVMAAQNVPFVGQLSLQFSLYVIGVIGMVYVLVVYVKETNYFTEENVIAPLSVEEQARVAGLVTEEQIESEAAKNKAAGMNAKDHKQDAEVIENA
ncbi:DUF895 domain membrane protein [Trichophyton interdigitale]|uniref:DUF895 domain membrane protein n=1 Tax=Trichophyton interdigitale TaxID=101480 RepID=A0A9P5CVH2_9EURO|nr:DUF895 domain membrane protein [Trichophyton interdigitale]KAF3899744.1 DUF895 domain membrane protein [Trichophyton interdigitale]KAG8211898.1 DUF895 domain membrane protein [Trichophyton interdigitale]